METLRRDTLTLTFIDDNLLNEKKKKTFYHFILLAFTSALKMKCQRIMQTTRRRTFSVKSF